MSHLELDLGQCLAAMPPDFDLQVAAVTEEDDKLIGVDLWGKKHRMSWGVQTVSPWPPYGLVTWDKDGWHGHGGKSIGPIRSKFIPLDQLPMPNPGENMKHETALFRQIIWHKLKAYALMCELEKVTGLSLREDDFDDEAQAYDEPGAALHIPAGDVETFLDAVRAEQRQDRFEEAEIYEEE